MAFALTVAVLLIVYLYELLPELRDFVISTAIYVLSAVAAILSLPSRFRVLTTPVSLLFTGFISAILLSRLLNGWLGGMLDALQKTQLAILIFFLVLITATTTRRIAILAGVLVGITLFMMLLGVLELNTADGSESTLFLLRQRSFYDEEGVPHFVMRLRGVGTVGDPNDFAQLFLLIIPFIMLPLRLGYGGLLRLGAWVALAASGYGLFLTQSRGSVLGIGVLLFMLLSKRLSKGWAMILSAGGLLTLLQVGLTGGRAMVTDNDRIEAWSAGIGMFKSSPLWGIGYLSFREHHPLTAHNSYILCLAEIGFLGYFFWIAMILATIAELSPYLAPPTSNDSTEPGPSKEETRTHLWASTFQMSLFTFLATSWFLSRTYAVTLFFLIALCNAWTYNQRAALATEPAPSPISVPSLVVRTVSLQFATLLTVYVMVRIFQ